MIKNKILFLGLGNEILSDDGIGPRLVKDLAKKNQGENIDFATSSCGGLEIMECIHGYKKVIFIDAIRTLNGKPGNIFHFIPSDFRETSNLSNLHDVNFITALHLGNVLDLDLPSDLHIIAVEIIEDREFSEKLTPALDKMYPEILEKVTSLTLQIVIDS
jgi:hydrogenase maturation protease